MSQDIPEKVWNGELEDLLGYKPVADKKHFSDASITVHHVSYPAVVAAHKGLVELSYNRLTRELIFRTTNHNGSLGLPISLGKFDATIINDYQMFGITLKDSINDY